MHKQTKGTHCNRSRCSLEDLLGWIGHLGAEEAQRLETLADGMDVGHTHEYHLTAGIVLYTHTQGKMYERETRK